MKEMLRDSLDIKWQESITGPDKTMPAVLTDNEEEFRMRLLQCQGRCKELEPLIASATKLLRATVKDSVVEDQKISQGYRLSKKLTEF